MGERDVRGCPVTVTDLDVKDALTLFKKFFASKKGDCFPDVMTRYEDEASE